MRRIPSLIIPGLVLIGCELLLQWHGWKFWSEHFDPAAGPALSVILAVLAAAWWFQSTSGRFLARVACFGLGLLASLLLLAGPLYVVSRPVIEARTIADARPAELARLDADLVARRAELSDYLAITAQGRFGWAGRIDDARQAIADLEAQRATLASVTHAGMPWQTWAACVLQALALVLLQIGAASMAATCGRRWRLAAAPVCRMEPRTPELEALAPVAHFEIVSAPEATDQAQPEAVETAEPETLAPSETIASHEAETAETPTASETEHPAETLFQATELAILRLQKTVAASLRASGLSLREWSKREGVNARDVSLLLNHFDLAKAGKQTVSAPKLKQFAQRFLKQQQAVGA